MEGCALPQSLILLKSLPDPDYLHSRYEEGIYRATMNFLPGGCWAGAALFNASTEYTTRSTTMASSASSCPDPMDTLGCLIWEALEIVRKVSNTYPLAFNSFAFLEREAGTTDAFLRAVEEIAGPDDGSTDYVDQGRGREYVAAAHLIGCGTYNTVVEVLADDHDRMLEILHGVTDLPSVKQYAVGRVRADDTRGWGEPDRTASTVE
jgi:hypothetical protein